jgi:hypothetical protein
MQTKEGDGTMSPLLAGVSALSLLVLLLLFEAEFTPHH